MDEFLGHLFSLALMPVTSQSMLVYIPAAAAMVYGCVCLLFDLMRGY